MTETETALQAAIDAAPGASTPRLALADYLAGAGDPRAAGYAALADLGAVPVFKPCEVPSWPHPQEPNWFYAASHRVDELAKSFRENESAIRRASLPREWCRAIYDMLPDEMTRVWNYGAGWYGYALSRREVEDFAATAFARLPEAVRAAILAGVPA